MKVALASVVASSIMFISGAALANPGFENSKTNLIKRLDDRIATLQQAKTCANNAKADGELKECHKSLRDERMAKRDGFKADRKEKMMQRGMKNREEKMKQNTNDKPAAPPVSDEGEVSGG